MHDAIIELIYDAIVDDGAVPNLARSMADHMHADTNWMLIGVGDQQDPAAMCVHGLDDDIVHAYEETYHRYDPWMDVVGKMPLDTPVSLDRWVSTRQFQQSLIYQDLARGRADVLHCLGLVISTGAVHSTFALQRGRKGPSFDEEDERRLLPYVDHLRRLATAAIRKTKVAPHEFDTLIGHPDPIIIVDHNAYPIHCSADGGALLEAGLVLTRTAAGRIHSVDQRFSIEATVRQAALRGVPTVGQVDPPCGAHLIAIDPCRALARHATITIRNQAAHAHRMVEQAGRRFALTDAEMRLTISLITGLTLEEHCLCHGTVVSTARSQLRAVFDKADVRRQCDLVTLVLSPPPPTIGGSVHEAATTVPC